MKKLKSVSRLISFSGWRNYWVFHAAALMILLAGLWMAQQAGYDTDRQMRQNLVRQAASIAGTIEPSEIRNLSFTAADKDRPGYRTLCNQMRSYAEMAGLESIYSMALRDGHLVFASAGLL